MNAVAYIRVSTDDQVKGTSLDSQEEAIIKFAKQHGFTLLPEHIFREEGVSAKLAYRPKLAEMLSLCLKQKGRFNYCIVWKIDRLARKSELHHYIKAQLFKAGTKLLSVTEPLTDDPAGHLMDSMLAAFAEFDNEIRTIRTTEGTKQRALQGGWPHSPMYGYSRHKTALDIPTLIPNDDAEKVIKLLVKFSSGSYNVKQAQGLAAEIGIRGRNGKRRRWQSVKDMLTNPIYIGKVRSKFTDGKWVDGVHPALIDESVYYKNVAIINGNMKNKSREAEVEWYLKGGFLRHTCGHRIISCPSRGRSGPSLRYSCYKCKVGDQLNYHVSRKRDLMHDEFVELLKQVKLKPGISKLFREIILSRWNVEYKDAIVQTKLINDQLETLTKRKSKVVDYFLDEKIDEATKDTKLSQIEAEIMQLKLKLVDADDYVSQKEEIVDGGMLFMSDPAAFWNIAGLESKKRIQDVLFPEGLVYDFDKGFEPPKLNKSYLLIEEILTKNAKNPSLVAASGLEPETFGL